jgi:HK97 family phage major capsid protein
MPTGNLQIPYWNVDTIPASGVSPFFGTATAKWGFEPTPSEVAEPKFNRCDLQAWDLMATAIISNQELADMGDEGESAFKKGLMKLLAWTAEFAFLRGGGVADKMPLGILNAPCTSTIARQTTATITIQDIANMTGTLLPYSWVNAIWACSPTALTKIQQLSSYYINLQIDNKADDKLMRRAAGMLSTFPLFVTEKLPSVGGRGDLILFDPTMYVIGKTLDMTVDFSADDPTVWTKQQSMFRIAYRLDGKPIYNSIITLQDTTTKVSPFVALGAL